MTDYSFQALTEWRIKMENSINETAKDIIEVKTTLSVLGSSMEAFHADQKDQHIKILEMMNKIDEKKADVWVERAMARLNWIVVSAVVGALVYLVLK